MIAGKVLVSLKVLALRSFHSSQEVSITSDAMAFLLLGWRRRTADHQDSTSLKEAQLGGSKSSSASQNLIIYQIRMEKRQCKRRWHAVSSARRQRGHSLPLGQPRRSRRSLVQTRFWMMSQEKNLHFGGAQCFQTRESIGERTRPANCAK